MLDFQRHDIMSLEARPSTIDGLALRNGFLRSLLCDPTVDPLRVYAMTKYVFTYSGCSSTSRREDFFLSKYPIRIFISFLKSLSSSHRYTKYLNNIYRCIFGKRYITASASIRLGLDLLAVIPFNFAFRDARYWVSYGNVSRL